MSDYTTNATVELNVNGQKAKNALEEQTQLVNNLRKAWAEAKASGDKTASSIEKEWKKATRELKSMRAETENVAEVLKRLDKATPKELKQTLRALEQQLNKIERGSEAWEKQVASIKRVREELDKVNRELRNGETFWGRFNRKMNDWQTSLAAGAAAVTGVVMAGRSAVNAYAEMDAEMANVRKFTGMTAEQVALLNQEFQKIDTRTSREDLNRLAQEAGRLGKTSQEDVLGFVKAADQINVALDDLGDGATLTLSKLTNIFGDEARLGTERSLLAVGSVINELSQNCTASAPYLAQFSQRLAGVGAQAGMTIPQLMAFAAVLDSQGQAVEMSATALSKLIMDLFKETDKIAKATGLDLEKFKATLESSTNDGLLMLLDQLKQLGGMDVLAPVFKDMGEEGARASAVISALAGNVDTVRWQQEEANKAFNEATSITKEFNVQNTTVQAGLDKARKRFNELAVELGEKLAPVMKHVISSTTLIMKAMSAIFSFIGKYKGELVVLTASIVAYNIAVNAATIKTKALAVAQGVAKGAVAAWTVVTQAAAVVTALFTGKLHKAKIEFMIFSAMLKASPIGLLVGAITAAVGALVLLSKKTNAVAEAQKALNNIRKEASVKLAEEKSKIDLLVSAANNEKLSLDERKKAIDKLNVIIPNYNAQLDKTTGKYRANKTALDEYLKSLVKKYEIEGAKEQLAEIGREKAQKNTELASAREQQERDDATASRIRSTHHVSNNPDVVIATNVGATIIEDNALDRIDDILHDIEILNEKEKRILAVYGVDLQKDAINATNAVTDDATPANFPTAGDDKNKDRFKTEQEWKEREEALNRIAYAKGEKNYEEYRKRVDAISVEYYAKLKSHSEASADEKLQFEAKYYDALEKQQNTHNTLSLEKENAHHNEIITKIKQRYIDGEINSTEAYQSAIELAELQHKQRLVQIYKEGTAERLKAEQDYQNALFIDEQRRRKKQEDQEKKHQSLLDKLKADYFGDNASEKNDKYNTDLNALTEVYNAELQAAGNNAAERLRIEEAFEKAKLALKVKYGIASVNESKNLLEQANNEIIEWLNSDAGKAVTQSFDTIVSGMSAIFSQMSSLVQAELEIETAAIEKRYDKEISRAEGNSYKVKQLEAQKEKEIAKAKNEANKKMFKMQVIQAVAQTAQNAIAAYGSAAAIPLVGFIMAPIAAAMAVTAGMLQIAAIKKQQQASASQGYASGGFTPKGGKYEPAGIVHKGEWVASQELLASPVARPLIDALDFAQRNNSIGSLQASDVSRSITAPAVIASANSNNAISDALTTQAVALAKYADAIKRLDNRLNEPFVTVNTVTGDDGIKKAQDEYDKLMRNKTPKSKRN